MLLGHAGPGAAMRYQHAATSRLADLASAVSDPSGQLGVPNRGGI